MFRKHKFTIVILVAVAVSMLACTRGQSAPDTPLETFKAYTRAIKAKDTAAMKALLSAETLKMHEQEAKSQGVSVDEILKRETLFSADQNTVKLKNETVNGDTATLEVENSLGTWETVPFKREDGKWKIDKKAWAQQMIDDFDRDQQQLDNIVNQGRQE